MAQRLIQDGSLLEISFGGVIELDEVLLVRHVDFFEIFNFLEEDGFCLFFCLLTHFFRLLYLFIVVTGIRSVNYLEQGSHLIVHVK